MAGCGQDGTGAGCGRLSLQAHGWWLKEHCNGDDAGLGLGYGRWTGTHSARQAQPGHRTAMLVRQGRQCKYGKGGSARSWGSLLVAQGLATGVSGGRAFGKVTENEPPPPKSHNGQFRYNSEIRLLHLQNNTI